MKQIVMMSWQIAATTAVCLFFMQAAGAQTLSEDMHLDQVVVTGTRVPVLQESLATPVTVVGRETIEQSGHNALLPVLSQEVPGLFVNSRGILGYGVSGGAAGNISMRGVTGADGRVLMLIDGHPQYAPIYGHPIADAYIAGDAERVEVSRGASSVLYGSNAMGGAINIITRRPQEDGNQAHLRAMAGSYGSQQYQLTDSYKQDRLTVFGGASYTRTDGHRQNSAFESLSAMGKVGYELSDTWRVSSHVNLAKFYAENPGSEANPMV
ncbi:MAG: TonB-dependent receptor plug domain-containing protein, partial [Bacteroidales bacterium]|nr:TonB-dependent receptor plug domain-containing protein [Bacteroidales bacterium]